MKIKCAMILAAGLGTRMKPVTLKTPKPLIKVGTKCLLDRSVELLIYHGIEEIVINVHHLADQVLNFIKKRKYKVKIIISDEQDQLLDTGGGILNGTKVFKEEPFFVINPDTLWSSGYLNDLKDLERLYFKSKKACLLLVNKKFIFDTSFKGDFNLNKNIITRDKDNEYIYTGLQILNKNKFSSTNKKIFSMNEIWNNLINQNNLLGVESDQKFYHLNTIEMYKKISSLKAID